MKILYLTSRLPIPPLVKGDTLRDFYILRELAARGHQIKLISFYKDGEQKKPSVEMLKAYCQEIHLIKFDKKIQALHLLKGLYSLKPFQVLFYSSKAFQREVNALLEQESFDVAYVHFTRLADFLKEHFIPKVIDLQDSFEKNLQERYARERNIFMKMLVLAEAQRMKVYEKQISQYFSYSTVVSERDVNAEHQNLFVVPNGRQDLKAVSKSDKQTNGLLFMGNMSYFPNEDAALFLIKEVMPVLVKKIPQIKLYIVGSNPSKKLLRYASEHIVITGFVQDLHPYLVEARIAVAPLRYGTGIQNKVLDAMMAGVPQIISSKAANGLSNLRGEEFLLSECDRETFIEKILLLWNNSELQERLVNNAREYVMQNYSWSKSVHILENLFKMSIEKAFPVRTSYEY